jgi:hypothetical protein
MRAGLLEGARNERDVGEARLLDRRRAERGGRVVHGEDAGVADAGRRVGRSDRPVRPTDRGAGHEPGHRVPAEGDDEGGVQRLELPSQVRGTGRHLVGLGVPVLGRPALHDVRDEHVLPPPADGAEEADEQLARPADERASLAVLVEAGAFANQHDRGVSRPFAGYGAGAGLGQAALLARPNLVG